MWLWTPSDCYKRASATNETHCSEELQGQATKKQQRWTQVWRDEDGNVKRYVIFRWLTAKWASEWVNTSVNEYVRTYVRAGVLARWPTQRGVTDCCPVAHRIVLRFFNDYCVSDISEGCIMYNWLQPRKHLIAATLRPSGAYVLSRLYASCARDLSVEVHGGTCLPIWTIVLELDTRNCVTAGEYTAYITKATESTAGLRFSIHSLTGVHFQIWMWCCNVWFVHSECWGLNSCRRWTH